LAAAAAAAAAAVVVVTRVLDATRGRMTHVMVAHSPKCFYLLFLLAKAMEAALLRALLVFHLPAIIEG
jgi:hypothetical protein